METKYDITLREIANFGEWITAKRLDEILLKIWGNE
jgi:hypothetical protein